MIKKNLKCISFNLLKACILIALFSLNNEDTIAQTWTQDGISVLSGAYNPSSVKPDIVPSRYRNLISPNPNNGEFFLKLDPNLSSEIDLTLINQVGQVIEKRQIQALSGCHEEYFNWTHLNKGLYILIISSDEFVFSEKVVIN